MPSSRTGSSAFSAFKEWASIFPNATCATALIDRVIHHTDVINVEGKSYRLREAEDTGAFTSPRFCKLVNIGECFSVRPEPLS